MADDPCKEAIIWRTLCQRENNEFSQQMLRRKPEMAQGPAYYRVPMDGEPVAILGAQSRPELNGLRGEVAGSTVDDSGRVTVRIFEDPLAGRGGPSRYMRIQPARLVPMEKAPPLEELLGRSASSPAFHGQHAGAASRSVGGSTPAGKKAVPGTSRRAQKLGMALSSTAQNMLSKGGSKHRGPSTPPFYTR